MRPADFPMDIAGIFFPTGICKSWNKLCMWDNHRLQVIWSPGHTRRTPCRQRWCPDRKAMINSPLTFDRLAVFAHCYISPGALFQYFKPLKSFRQPQKWSRQRNISSFPPQVCNFCIGLFGSEVQVRSRRSLGAGQLFWTEDVTAWMFATLGVRHSHICLKGVEVLGLTLKSLLYSRHWSLAISSRDPRISSC